MLSADPALLNPLKFQVFVEPMTVSTATTIRPPGWTANAPACPVPAEESVQSVLLPAAAYCRRANPPLHHYCRPTKSIWPPGCIASSGSATIVVVVIVPLLPKPVSNEPLEVNRSNSVEPEPADRPTAATI